MRPTEVINGNKKEDLEDVAYRSIMSMILKNQIRPGDAVLETEFAKMLNVSRTPVRQAFGRLITEGLLEKRRKKGCVISVPTPIDAQKVFQAREFMETQVAKLASQNATKTDIDELKRILDVEATAFATYNKEEYWLANEQFHFRIMKAAKNPYLERYCRHILRRSSIYIFFFESFYTLTSNQKSPPRQISPQQHFQILEAIKEKDPDRAQELMRFHIQYALEVLIGI